eukprot:6724965-Prorocentrum_lima.AAC.1
MMFMASSSGPRARSSAAGAAQASLEKLKTAFVVSFFLVASLFFLVDFFPTWVCSAAVSSVGS